MKINDLLNEAIKQRLDAKCWKGKHKEGTKIKGGVRVNNCVPNESIDESSDRCQQCGMTDCTCAPGKCKCKPIKGWIPNKGFKEAIDEAEKKGLYYNVNKRKAAGTSRDASHPKAPTAQAWKDAAKTAKKEGVAEGSLNEFALDGFNGSDDGEEFNSNLAKMAYDEGVVKGVSLADGATLKVAIAINDWDKHDGGIYSQHFAKGFKVGRMNKINHDNKRHNLNLKLMKDGSIRHGEINEYGDTAKGQKMLTKVQKRAVDRVTSKKADTDPAYAKKNKETADRSWERMSDKDLDEGEQRMSRAAKGNEKYGKDGMKALAKAGREGASEEKLDKIRDKHDKYDEGIDELSRVLELSGLNLTADEQFDIIEEMVESLALEYEVDAETIWEDFESVDDDELLESAAWKRKEGKSKAGGLNAKGVASYRRENPGSKLQTAVTTKPSKLKPGSKAAKRRKSFCARMSGNKGPMKKPNGDPTRKALALRKWNC